MGEGGPYVVQQLDRSTELAYRRTRAAYERTMMAWIRTATSLITFGFSIYKFFQLEAFSKQQHVLVGPRQFALLLVSIGLVSLLLATFEFRHNIKTLVAESGDNRRSMAVVVAGLVSALGVIALLLVILRQ